MTLEEVAKIVGVTRQTILKYENGLISNIPSDKIELLAKALRTSPAYIMGWADDSTVDDGDGIEVSTDVMRMTSRPLTNALPLPRTHKVPLVGTIACGRPILAVEDAEDTVDAPEFVHADFALTCKGDSMINARIFDGDIVYIRSQPEVENGQIAAVRIGDEATLKRVYYTPGSDRITLRACNPLYADMVYEGEALDQIQVLGLAVGFYSTIRHEQ